MAEHRRFADLNYGHAGLLTYIPSDNPEDGPGELHTARATTSSLHFRIVGSSAQLYPPSKPPTPVAAPSHLWEERQVQRRWLLNAHPEAFMGDAPIQQLLKDDMERFKKADDQPDRKPLLAVGLMADLTNQWDLKGIPVLAVATGHSGQQLRLVRLEESQWQWGDYKDVCLNLSVIDPVYQEEETIWTSDSVPITQVKFATHVSQHGYTRWLLMQKSTGTTILQPEYNLVPVPQGDSTDGRGEQGPSFISPNPLLTLQAGQTGGNAHSDMILNPHSPGHPPQLGVIDECGYWSIWNIMGKSDAVKNTYHLTPFKCGHIAEGPLGEIPTAPVYPATRHGMLGIGGSRDRAAYRDPVKGAGPSGTVVAPSSHVLLWNSEQVELFDLESSTVSRKLDILSSAYRRPDRILDVQPDPKSQDKVFVLTTRQIIWVDLGFVNNQAEDMSEATILLTCSHPGVGNEDLRLAAAPSADETESVLVFTHSPDSEELCVYWFSISRSTGLPQWHRDITQLPGTGELRQRARAQLLRVHPAKLVVSPRRSSVGPGSRYLESDTRFYQLMVLTDDLGLRYSMYSSICDPTIEVTLPTTRLGWSKSEQRRRWKMRRRHFLQHVTDAFVVPDAMGQDDMAALLKQGDFEEEEKPQALDQNRRKPERRPIPLKFDRIAGAIREQLRLSAAQGPVGLPTALFDALRSFIEHGLEFGLPLTTWAEVASSLEHPVLFRPPEDGMEEDVERLFDANNDTVVVTQLRRHSPKEPADALLGLPYLQEQYSALWLDPGSSLAEEFQQIRRAWVREVALDVFLSSYGIMVQHVPLLGECAADPNETVVEESTILPATPPHRSPRIASSSPGPAPSTPPASSTQADAAVQRLMLLASFQESAPPAPTKQSKVLAYWPAERGVDIQDYVSSVAVAAEERFSGARQRLHRIETKRKALAEKYKRPAFMRQGFPMSDGFSQEATSLPVRPPPAQAMSSQQAVPESSQTQIGPMVTMSQPVAGTFGGDRKKKKGKPCSKPANGSFARACSMSHCHDEHAGYGSHDHHEHDHSDDITPALQSSLYEQINFDEITTLNESRRDAGKAVVKKTWAERLSAEPELESDADEQLLMTVPFTEQVKLHSILLRTSPSPSAPRTLHLYVNRADLDFSAAEELDPVQKLELSQTSDVQEIPVKRALFGKVQRLGLFFVDNFGDGDEDVSRLSYVGFKGEWTRLGRAPTNILYEAAAQPGDHKLKGTSINKMGSDIGGGRGPGM
ncbi:RNA polymerase I-specific transcription initiation factor RRN6 [Purpureocillium lavendulum]|uniref:RNA polymerase I-specific transcription initiation factor RRN6 n=1 Tax=Purpureocillium lavendulum TaxID=1247861 RepID=A0AB34FKZ0_9HYPO|nr:RNA polymerase I-specific transcription initiation factor RRN6 [Purpureocillium lavendulum]